VAGLLALAFGVTVRVRHRTDGKRPH
jgi:hypothetical protein